MDKISPCLWFDGNAEEAARFYADKFPNSSVDAVNLGPTDNPGGGKAGQVLTVEFTVFGMKMLGLNGGPNFKFDEAISFQVYTDDQAETDRYWNAIVENGGQASECGWCKDKFGLSWQITPRILMDVTTGSDRAAAKRALDAMMTMQKIDVAKIEAAATVSEETGFYLAPLLIGDVANDAEISQEELFGPVGVVMPCEFK